MHSLVSSKLNFAHNRLLSLLAIIMTSFPIICKNTVSKYTQFNRTSLDL